jgi:hypothetical protein
VFCGAEGVSDVVAGFSGGSGALGCSRTGAGLSEPVSTGPAGCSLKIIPGVRPAVAECTADLRVSVDVALAGWLVAVVLAPVVLAVVPVVELVCVAGSPAASAGACPPAGPLSTRTSVSTPPAVSEPAMPASKAFFRTVPP